MKFITVNHSLNLVYQIEDAVFEQIILKSVSLVPGVNLISQNVVITSSQSDVSLALTISKDPELDYSFVLNAITSHIDRLVFNLSETKPKNIQITVQ